MGSISQQYVRLCPSFPIAVNEWTVTNLDPILIFVVYFSSSAGLSRHEEAEGCADKTWTLCQVTVPNMMHWIPINTFWPFMVAMLPAAVPGPNPSCKPFPAVLGVLAGNPPTVQSVAPSARKFQLSHPHQATFFGFQPHQENSSYYHLKVLIRNSGVSELSQSELRLRG